LSKQDRYIFFQWIDRLESFDINIILFPYDRYESSPFRSFKRWVPPPPNPPPMIDAEKDEASVHCVHNPPMCKCGYRAELVNPPAEMDYTPFFHCLIPLTVILAKDVIYFVVIKVLGVCI
jgi:hypothetical protein